MKGRKMAVVVVVVICKLHSDAGGDLFVFRRNGTHGKFARDDTLTTYTLGLHAHSRKNGP